VNVSRGTLNKGVALEAVKAFSIIPLLIKHRYLHNFLTLKYNELQVRIAPSPVGEGWGEENKIKALPFPSSNLLPLEKAFRLV